MSYYTQQEYDFVQRTKIILEQYQKLKISANEKYEITLLINCFTGLLILPQQYWFDNLPNEIISEKEWGIKTEYINIIAGNNKSVKEIVRHLRNSVAHYKFEVFENQKKEIKSIKFKDYTTNGVITFEGEVPVKNLNIFLNKFSNWFLEEMKK
ncbi:HEPN family nuclease [Epilithonimonas zeae]|uniref:pEK499-p136 HEPN domain-containing protein n=1 Tax=Epilithonimonas zeae TaxID=1416779 RepID=A0A1N6IFG2_9FLAO|nr:HEPN family nuclease [Epilithonimonas zeae]SIO30777.1 hypothetical protein SAMN05444409_2610 [Epilithonimonas zeae]